MKKALFAFTTIIIVNEGSSSFMSKQKQVDSSGTIEVTKNVKILNESTAVRRAGNNIYYYFNNKNNKSQQHD